MDAEGLVDPRRGSWVEQDLRTARLRTLSGMGLASEQRGRLWKLDPELETTLREIGRRGDIVRTMNYALRIAMQPRAPQDQAIYDPGAADARPVVGRLVASGLADEHADRRFLIVDGVDGHTQYGDVGTNMLEARPGAIVQIEPRQAGVREVDRTIAAIAAASKGWHSIELHQFRDPTATEAFATAHLRRLEALRRSGLPVEREVDGYWLIPPDHLSGSCASAATGLIFCPSGTERPGSPGRSLLRSRWSLDAGSGSRFEKQSTGACSGSRLSGLST